MTANKKAIELSIDEIKQLTVADALEQNLIYLKSDMPKTDGRLSRLVESLVRDTSLSYVDIVAKVKSEFPQANTSTKSVASVACVMRKKGVRVPLRLKLNIV